MTFDDIKTFSSHLDAHESGVVNIRSSEPNWNIPNNKVVYVDDEELKSDDHAGAAAAQDFDDHDVRMEVLENAATEAERIAQASRRRLE